MSFCIVYKCKDSSIIVFLRCIGECWGALCVECRGFPLPSTCSSQAGAYAAARARLFLEEKSGTDRDTRGKTRDQINEVRTASFGSQALPSWLPSPRFIHRTVASKFIDFVFEM